MPTLFNMVVNSVVFHCISMTVGDEAVIQDRQGYVLEWILEVFYKYYGLLGSW